MRLTMKTLENFNIETKDGQGWEVVDVYFDIDMNAVRYLVVDAGSWFQTKNVLVSPLLIKSYDMETETFYLNISDEQLKQSPGYDETQPLSRQLEIEYNKYFSIPAYWYGGAVWGTAQTPNDLMQQRLEHYIEKTQELSQKNHLRSFNEITSYAVHAVDGEVGKIIDAIVDFKNWNLVHFVVRTSSWFRGQEVLIPPIWMERMSWSQKVFYCGMKKGQIKSAPVFDSSKAINRVYEMKLYDYLGRPHYWSSEMDHLKEIGEDQVEAGDHSGLRGEIPSGRDISS